MPFLRSILVENRKDSGIFVGWKISVNHSFHVFWGDVRGWLVLELHCAQIIAWRSAGNSLSESSGFFCFRAREEMRQVAPAEDDTLNAGSICKNSKENNVATHHSEPRFFPDLGAELVQIRLLADLENGLPNLADEADRTLRAFRGDVICDPFEVSFDKARKL